MTDEQLVKREKTWEAFNTGWCPNCGDFVDMESVPTGLPGIPACNCLRCGSGFMVNFLEDGQDLLKVPAHYTWVPANG